jgi:hypothetical protein
LTEPDRSFAFCSDVCLASFIEEAEAEHRPLPDLSIGGGVGVEKPTLD